MGIRMDQHEGLPEQAKKFLEWTEVPQKVCDCCKRPLPRDLEIIGHYIGMFDQEYNLYRHQLTDVTWADEFLQEIVSDSGPVFFLGLRLQNGTEFRWEWSEITKKTGIIPAEELRL